MRAVVRALALCALLTVPTTAHADSILVSVSSVVFNGVDYTWNYTATLTSLSRIEPFDGVLTNTETVNPDGFFVIFDFNGYVAGSITTNGNTDWTASAEPTSLQPFGTIAPDSPALTNLFFYWNDAAVGVTGETILGTFSARSTLSSGIFGGRYSGQDTNNDPASQNFNTTQGNTGILVVPCLDTSTPGCIPLDTPVPEPGSMLLLGSGLMGLAASARRRLRKKAEKAQ